ncbi:MAG: Phosphate-selective porin, partial [Deltaproteobacteria bacterium]|nr:Phosphate-selective porin [Deltaproteobacteria bacterium]
MSQSVALPSTEPSTVQLGGFLQALYRARQDDANAAADTNGFKLARVRLTGLAQTRAGNLELSAFVEAELQPSFELEDAYATVVRRLPHGKLSVDGGQMRVPISRQNLLSDSRLAFVDKAQLATIAPDRDLGVRAALQLKPARSVPEVRVIAGAFNGEGKNQVENINQDYLYAGRLEITPFGHEEQYAESSFAGRFLTF